MGAITRTGTNATGTAARIQTSRISARMFSPGFPARAWRRHTVHAGQLQPADDVTRTTRVPRVLVWLTVNLVSQASPQQAHGGGHSMMRAERVTRVRDVDGRW